METMREEYSQPEYNLTSTERYLDQGNSALADAQHAADFFYDSRREDDPANNSTAARLILGSNTSLGSDTNPLQGNLFHNPQLLVSHQDQLGESEAAHPHSSVTALPFSTLPRPNPNSSAYRGLPHFPFPQLPTSWNEPPIIQNRQSRLQTAPVTFSSGFNFAPQLTMPGQYPGATHLSHGRYGPGSILFPSFTSSQYQNHITRAPETVIPQNTFLGHQPSPDQAGPSTQPSFPADMRGLPQKDGPPFEKTTIVTPTIAQAGPGLTPVIVAQILKGFFEVENKWTCYRRNYFSVNCGFGFKEKMDPLTTVYAFTAGQYRPIYAYAISISAKTACGSSQESEVRGLVQHTPKRDKASESVPKKVHISPSLVQESENGVVVTSPPPYGSNMTLSTCPPLDYGRYDSRTTQPPPPASHMFERIQFQKATANNGKRRAQQQYFRIVVELWADMSEDPNIEDMILLATKESFPAVVRGRSPGHYRDNPRRGSQTGTDGGDAVGNSADGSHQLMQLSPFGHSTTSSEWDPTRQSSHQYGGSMYEQSDRSGPSPQSANSSSPRRESSSDYRAQPQPQPQPQMNNMHAGPSRPMVERYNTFTANTPWAYGFSQHTSPNPTNDSFRPRYEEEVPGFPPMLDLTLPDAPPAAAANPWPSSSVRGSLSASS